MFGFSQKCPVCGMKLDSKNTVERNGKKFCSEEHAKQFEESKNKQGHESHSGGCCH